MSVAGHFNSCSSLQHADLPSLRAFAHAVPTALPHLFVGYALFWEAYPESLTSLCSQQPEHTDVTTPCFLISPLHCKRR